MNAVNFLGIRTDNKPTWKADTDKIYNKLAKIYIQLIKLLQPK
jgi:hypothetical protein